MTFAIAPLPLPGDTYDQRYFNEIVRSLNLHFRQIQNPGPVVCSSITVINLPTAAAGLPSGSLWVDAAAAYVIKMVP